MPKKIFCKNGKSFTYLTPAEKVEKYTRELKVGVLTDYWGMPKFKNKKPYELRYLTKKQRKYRENYISAYHFLSNSDSKGVLDSARDFNVFKKFFDKKTKR